MNNISRWHIISTGLAIFSMFFGAGDLIYPIMVGVTSGQHNLIGLAGFLITTVLLPLAGLVAMILFDGDYKAFFNRLGNIPGQLLIATCMIIIGPLIAIPRITTLSHTMIAPFIPWEILRTITPFSSALFAFIFLGITFLATYRENKIVDLLGTIVSPLLLISLAIIIIKGFFSQSAPITAGDDLLNIFQINFMRGYETLDLLAAIFFASIVIKILRQTTESNIKTLAWFGLQAGLLGVFLLALVYIGMSYLGVNHGAELAGNAGEIFREISFRVLGGHGALIIATAVLMACLSTSIALGAVVAEYFKEVICKNRIGFVTSLALVMLASIPLSIYGLGAVLSLTGGIITYVGYPVMIALTFANIAYKLCNFRPVVVPVLATFVIALVSYYR